MTAVSRRFQLKTAFQPDTCFQCHKDRRAQMFMSSHMPMGEGKIVCSDCHAPHGSTTEALLNKASVNNVCYTCHAEKRGPFLFEHEPVRENCLNCHDPHGSINQYSLKVPRPRLCNECHSIMESTNVNHSAFSNGASCQNCHIQIHGSNSPQGALSAAARRGRFDFRRGLGLDLGSSNRRMHRLASSVTCVVHDIAANALL